MHQLVDKSQVIQQRRNRSLAVFAAMMVASACQPIADSDTKMQSDNVQVDDGNTIPTPPLHFLLQDSGHRQLLEVDELANGTLSVSIAVVEPCSRREIGIAERISENGDREVEVDPFGEGHPANAFFMEPRTDCTIAVYLAVGERRYAWLRESDECSSCSVSDEPMTRQ